MEETNLRRCAGATAKGRKWERITAPHMTSVNDFGPHKKSKDGLNTRCRDCISAYSTSSTPFGPEMDPNLKRCAGFKGRNHHYTLRQNFARSSNRRDGLNSLCDECRSVSTSQWQKDNPEKVRTKEQRRRQREAEVHLQDVLITELLERYNSQCVYCETPVDIKTGVHEHVVPVVNGGFGANFNAVLACGSCNSSKGGRAYHTWYDTHHDKRKIVLYPDLYLWSAQWEARSLQLQKYRETVKSPEFIETIKSNPELLEHEYLKTGLAAKSLQNSL